MKIFAHRGFSGLYPENTMLAFEKALEAGADGIELDVHLSKDGKPVIIHDEALFRTTGLKGNVFDFNSSELMKINANNGRDCFTVTPIPSFEEYCDFVSKNDLITNVEIKTNIVWYEDIEKKVVELIKDYNLEDRVIISSFNWLSVMKVKNLDKKLKTALLYENSGIIGIARQAADNGIDFIHPDFHLVNDTLLEDAKKVNVGINVWTVNEIKDVDLMVKNNIFGIITNHPDRIIGRLDNI